MKAARKAKGMLQGKKRQRRHVSTMVRCSKGGVLSIRFDGRAFWFRGLADLRGASPRRSDAPSTPCGWPRSHRTLFGGGRDSGHPEPPAQIRACGSTAPVSYLESRRQTGIFAEGE